MKSLTAKKWMLIPLVMLMFSCSSESKTLSISPKSLDFGEVGIEETATKEITLTNKYGKDIEVSTIALSGSTDFIIVEGGSVPVTMLKGEKHIIKIAFIPADAGIETGMLEIANNAAPTKSKFVDITGTGIIVPKIELAVTSYDFKKKIINKPHTHDFVIENKGTDVLKISSMTFTGSGALAFAVTAGDAPVDVPAKTTHTITVTFSPTAVSIYDAVLNISSDAINSGNPDTITIDGEGVDKDPQITLSIGSSWDFGSVATTIPSTQICEIESTGLDPMTISDAVLTSGVDFVIAKVEDSLGNPVSYPHKINVGEKIYLYVKFSPTGQISYNDTLTISHDGTNEVPQWDIPVSGIGRAELTKTFSYTGAEQQWTIPVGVSVLIVECWGAQGGPSQNGSLPGKGGYAKASVPVTPGDPIYVYVGGQGFVHKDSPTGGWNGGGGTNSTYTSFWPGTGGGGSDIRIGGNDWSNRVIVGAGGGGGGHSNYSATGGFGGGLTGVSGTGSTNYTNATGGTQTAGGAAGYNSSTSALPGTFGEGGRGKGYASGGGGGGGGWYGGGGGLLNSGAGGSSYYDAKGNTNKSTQTGVQTGDGKVKIKY